MNEIKEEKTITMTEEQLEKVIKTAVKTALRDLKEEEELPGNEVNELKEAPATFSLITTIANLFLFFIIVFIISLMGFCLYLIAQDGFSFFKLEMLILFLILGVLTGISMWEVNKTKKIEVINTIFSSIMALSSLIVAIIGAVFAYKALK